MSNGLFLATLVAYALGIATAVLAMLRRARWARAAAPVLFVLAWLGHSGTIVQSALSADRFPLSNLGEYLLAFGWAVLTLHLYVWLRLRVDATGIVLPTIAAVSTAGALAFQNPVGSSSQEQLPGWFGVHVPLATLGPDFMNLFWSFFRTPAAQRREKAIARASRSCAAHFALLDAELAARPFLAGSSFSMGDVPAGTMLYRMETSDSLDDPAVLAKILLSTLPAK